MQNVPRVLFTIFCVLLIGTARAQNEDPCRVVIELAAHNVSESRVTNEVKQAHADALCSLEAGNKGSQKYQEASAGFSGFSASYGRGESDYDAYYKSYCSAGRSSYFGKSTASQNSVTVFGDALSHWKGCTDNRARGVHVASALSPDNSFVAVNMSYTGPGVTTPLRAVDSSNSSMKCFESTSKIAINEVIKSVRLISPDSFVFHCRREDTSRADILTISTAADARPYVITLPAQPKEPTPTDTRLRQYAERIAWLESRLTYISDVFHARIDSVEKRESVRGMFQETSGACTISNPYTGLCSCTDGYSRRQAAKLTPTSTISYCTRDGGK